MIKLNLIVKHAYNQISNKNLKQVHLGLVKMGGGGGEGYLHPEVWKNSHKNPQILRKEHQDPFFFIIIPFQFSILEN